MAGSLSTWWAHIHLILLLSVQYPVPLHSRCPQPRHSVSLYNISKSSFAWRDNQPTTGYEKKSNAFLHGLQTESPLLKEVLGTPVSPSLGESAFYTVGLKFLFLTAKLFATPPCEPSECFVKSLTHSVLMALCFLVKIS